LCGLAVALPVRALPLCEKLALAVRPMPIAVLR